MSLRQENISLYDEKTLRFTKNAFKHYPLLKGIDLQFTICRFQIMLTFISQLSIQPTERSVFPLKESTDTESPTRNTEQINQRNEVMSPSRNQPI